VTKPFIRLTGEIPLEGPDGVLSPALGRSVVQAVLKRQQYLLEIDPKVSLSFLLRVQDRKLRFDVAELNPCEREDPQAYVADRILEKYESVYILARIPPKFVPTDLGTDAYLLGEFTDGVVSPETVHFEFHQWLFPVKAGELGDLRDDLWQALPTILAADKVPGSA
jgi:hypothetical protein